MTIRANIITLPQKKRVPGILLKGKLMNQWFLMLKFISSLRKCYCRHDHEYVPFVVIIILSFFAFIAYDRVCDKSSTSRGAASGTGTAYSSVAPVFTTFLVVFVLFMSSNYIFSRF